MTRSTLWLAALLAVGGCDRQVNLDDAASAVGSLVTPATNASGAPAELLVTSQPVVFGPVNTDNTDNGSNSNNDDSEPATSEGAANTDEGANPQVGSDSDTGDNNPDTTATQRRRVSVRLREPELLMATSNLVAFTPVLINTDGNRTVMDCCDADNAWTADLELDSDNRWQGSVQWLTPFADGELPVLQADVQLNDPGDDVIDVSPAAYERATDTDGDGIGNLTEIVVGTNPMLLSDADAAFLDASVRIPRVDPLRVPVIDGRAGTYEMGTTQFTGEWENAVQLDVNGNRLSIDNRMFATEGFATEPENHHWLALHDGTWLYLLVVIDDAGQHHFDSREVAKPWRDDSIEIFIDGDNSQRQSYDGVDDFSMHVMTLDSSGSGSNSSSNASPNVFRSINSVPLPAGLSYSTGPLQGPTAPSAFGSNGIGQDVFEIALRISDLNIELGRTFGFEIQFDDDDDAGDRDAKWGWAHPAGNSSDNDFTWRDPSFMGRVVLLP